MKRDPELFFRVKQETANFEVGSHKDAQEVIDKTISQLKKKPDLFLRDGLSRNTNKKPSGWHAPETVYRSGDGWLLYFAWEKFYRSEKNAQDFVSVINRIIYEKHEQSLVSLSDDQGPDRLAEVLKKSVIPELPKWF